MRLLVTLMILVICTSLKAQSIFPAWNNTYVNSINSSPHFYDSMAPKKWFMIRSVSLTAGYSFFKGGGAAFTSIPVSVQINRRLNNNLFAFAGVSVAPTYINFKRAFVNTNISKTSNNLNFFNKNNFNTYSSAALGLMYVNDAKTFSISGSIGVERSDYPVYYSPVNTFKPVNNAPVYR